MKHGSVISVIIPTFQRPRLLARALRSALSQTYRDIEVLVVIDGPDEATTKRLAEATDPRLRVIQLDENRGGAAARNVGVSAARGQFIAFLDDDDEWLPEKLERQMLVLRSADYSDPIVSCRFWAITQSETTIRPKHLLSPAQHLSEYLFVRRGLGGCDGFIATPTIITTRSLLQRVPFQDGLKKHQDWDWILRAAAEPGSGILFCPEALAICHMDRDDTTSRRPDWQFSLNWIHANQHRITCRAYASFVAVHVGWQAAAQRAWSFFFYLLRDAAVNGALRGSDVLRYVSLWLLPFRLRRSLKSVKGRPAAARRWKAVRGARPSRTTAEHISGVIG